MAAERDRSPLSAWRQTRGLGVIGGLLALMLIAAVWLQARQLTLVEQSLRSNDSFSVLSLYQVEIEYLRLRDQWRETVTSPTPDLSALQLRYDVWVSRVTLASTPGLLELMAGDPTYTDTLAQVQDFVRRADVILGINRSESPSPAGLAALTEPLLALSAPLHAMTLAAAHQVAVRADASNDALRSESRLGVALSIFLCALSAAFALLAMRQMHKSQQRSAALEALSTELHEARHHEEAANKAKSAFLAYMSHEIRTPFQGLLGMLALLRNGGLTPRQNEQLRIATESGDHLLAVLNDVLDLSQLEAGRLSLRPMAVDLPALLRQVEAVMRPLASAKSLRLQVDADPDMPRWILADSTRLKQVLFNLLSNAIKFCVQGSVALEVQCQAGPPERLRFIVTDSGVGMDRNATERLFHPSAPGAAPQPLPQPQAGAGLGLEISRKLVGLMGGDIRVQSVPGEGSRFTFDLPLRRAADPAAVRKAPPSASVQSPQRPLRVLVAEDHPVNRQYMAALLEQMHHPAHFVADGRAAVQAVQDRPFDLVLMDLHMPELDGIGATQAIRALPDPTAATVPIIALTADAFKETRERCLVAGMNDFLTKPIDAQDLAAALRRLFGQEAAQAPPSFPAAAPAAPSGAPLLDLAAVERVRRSVTAEQLASLIEAFLVSGPQTVHAMRTAMRDGQPLALRAEAHSARGAALNLGLAALAQTAQALHEGAIHLPAHEVVHLVQQFETQLDATRRAVAEAGLVTTVPS